MIYLAYSYIILYINGRKDKISPKRQNPHKKFKKSCISVEKTIKMSYNIIIMLYQKTEVNMNKVLEKIIALILVVTNINNND